MGRLQQLTHIVGDNCLVGTVLKERRGQTDSSSVDARPFEGLRVLDPASSRDDARAPLQAFDMVPIEEAIEHLMKLRDPKYFFHDAETGQARIVDRGTDQFVPGTSVHLVAEIARA